MDRTIEDVLFEIVAVCEELALEFAIMGGIAVRVHGIPRPTFDVDLQMTVTQSQLEGFFERCEERGYTIGDAYRSGWRDEVGGMPLVKLKTYLNSETSDSGNSVDVDVFINDTPFQQSIMRRRQYCELSGRTVPLVTPEDLILLKLLANRPRDLGDIADVLFVQGRLDEPYMYHWAACLGISDRLKNALESS
jgi:predicted nucleotidyltransferase